jgi:predicted nuclease with TOPRIM domain
VRLIHLALHVALTGALIFSVANTIEAKRDKVELVEQMHAVTSERNNLIREREDLESQVEKAKADSSRLRDMVAFHMRACR